MKNSLLITLALTSLVSFSSYARSSESHPWDHPNWEAKYSPTERNKIKREKSEFLRKKSIAQYVEGAKGLVANKLGVSPTSLVNFWDSLEDHFVEEAPSHECINKLTHSDQGRTDFLNCLSQYGKNGLTEKLFGEINKRKIKIMKTLKDNVNLQKTVSLSFIVEDLIRYQLEDRGIKASWWVPGKGFLNTNDRFDFNYLNGDVLLEIGYSAVSAIITQSTLPQRKFSHALLIKDRGNNDFGTMEALIQTGVITRSKKELLDSNIQTLMVMRIADEEKRKFVSDIAANCGWEHVEKNTNYDLDFDGNDHSKIFCSELVASCYAKGIKAYNDKNGDKSMDYQMVYDTFTDHQSSIVTDNTFNFLKNFGMKKKTMPSPGDIFTSPYLEVQADYRPTESNQDALGMSRLWNVMFWGDLFVEKLDNGHDFEFSWISKYVLQPVINTINRVADSISGDEMKIIPTGFDAKKGGYLAAMDKLVYAPTTEMALKNMEKDGFNHASILATPIWVRAGYMKHALETNTKTNWILKK